MEARSPRKGRRALLWVALGVVALAGVAGLALAARNAGKSPGRKQKKDEAPPPAPVELAAARTGDLSTWLQTTAVLEARNAAALVARREGQVVALPVEEGQWVEQGAVLARLDDTEARMALERAEVAEAQARNEAERGQKLRERGFLSPSEWDALDLKLRQAQVELHQAGYDLDQTRVTAPFSGRIVERMVNLGESVASGKACFRLADFDPVRARLYFPERELSRVRVGQAATVTVDAQAGLEFPARVVLVSPAVDRANGTVKVTLELANPSARLRPGSFARVRLKTGTVEGAVVVPRRGVLDEDGENYVFVAQGDTVVRRAVKLGAVEEERAQILAGLVPGERIVTLGHGGLKPGSRIKAVTF